jgi:hypothetical protein
MRKEARSVACSGLSSLAPGFMEVPQTEVEVRYPDGGFLIKTTQGDQFIIFLP